MVQHVYKVILLPERLCWESGYWFVADRVTVYTLHILYSTIKKLVVLHPDLIKGISCISLITPHSHKLRLRIYMATARLTKQCSMAIVLVC